MPFDISIEPLALQDIQKEIDYYDEQQIGLGHTFEEILDNHFTSIETNPFFQIRYDNVHCLPVNKYPYMIHFTINETDNKVTVRAVFHTSLDPDKWTDR
ncbi:hypothetical protein MNBD_UNCLBAC01-296 [hydrothermal vent metagenome]|uniref:Type II toxin-antitoxin system RelE/ParE family toxin n=2 Tax=hydrothermal vent metagenome TaxID=652676 RepID=A0A3B1DJV4_9ZZZZ